MRLGDPVLFKAIHFQNFKTLRSTTLPLERFTLLIGPNGSGKSTAIQAVLGVAGKEELSYRQIVSAGLRQEETAVVTVSWMPGKSPSYSTRFIWRHPNSASIDHLSSDGHAVPTNVQTVLNDFLGRVRWFSLDAQILWRPLGITANSELGSNGENLVGVLDRLRDESPERFEALNAEFSRCLPEFDRILFHVPTHGQRGFKLRMKEGQHPISASELSQGTLITLAFLTLAHLPNPPSLICLEEPDRGLHPRLLRELRDTLYRLSYPERHGEKRPPVQVLATTHSPYFLDLFRDQPNEVVISSKVGSEASFEQLSGRADLKDLLRDAHLGEIWFSGILGGVPPKT